MRSLSLLLLDKNTQVVNTHEQVGGLIGTVKKYSYNIQPGKEVSVNLTKGCYILASDISTSITYFLYSRKASPAYSEIKTLGNAIGYVSDKIIYINAETDKDIMIRNNHTSVINVYIREINV